MRIAEVQVPAMRVAGVVLGEMFGMKTLLSFFLLFGLAAPATAAPSAEPWPLWERRDSASTASVDHGFWAGFLRRYLKTGCADGINRIDYAAVGKQDRDALEADLGRQSAVPISRYDRGEQRAFWTDLYNELTVLVVLRHYPVGSIRDIDISPGIFSLGPWDKKLIEIEGTRLSLNDIEHRILRPSWHDPRTHYSLNCASLGCPNLQPEAYTAANMDALLDRGAREYVNNPRGFRVVGGRLIVSSLYVWYKADFGGTDAGVIAHLQRWATPERAKELDGSERIAGSAYDWRLNDAGSGKSGSCALP